MIIPRFYGRLGNVLFQAAAAIGYAKKHGLEFTVPNTTNDSKWNPLYLQHLVNPLYRPRWKRNIVIKEQGHEYNELPFDEGWRYHNIVLDGYFQSDKYFKEYKDDVIRLFDLGEINTINAVSIHVRRGDYLQHPTKHPICTKEYYNRALVEIQQREYFERVIVFSDDIGWCQENFKDYGHITFSFSDGRNTMQDLLLMASCRHNIIANSSYSWWAAYLGSYPDKVVVAPKVWFGPGNGHLETRDIYCENWIQL